MGSIRKSQRAFPHPHFDKPIPDPTEADNLLSLTSGMRTIAGASQYLILRKTFFDVIRDTNYMWDVLPIARSLEKLRLENTKVKGDGASVVLEKLSLIHI